MMKKTFTLMTTIAIILAAITSCANPYKARLKEYVESMNDACPINMGILGTFTSTTYDEAAADVVTFDYAIDTRILPLKVFKDNEQLFNQSMRLLFVQTELRQMLELMTKADASLAVSFCSATDPNDRFTTSLSKADLKKIYNHPLSKREAAKLLLECQMEIVNSSASDLAPVPGVQLDSMTDDGKYLIYSYTLKNAPTPFKKSAVELDQLKRKMRESFDQFMMQQLIDALAELDQGLQYVWTAENSGESVTITFTPSEIKHYARKN